MADEIRDLNAKFQSISSMWRMTAFSSVKAVSGTISIHILHVEDDGILTDDEFDLWIFQSTSSMRRMT